MNKALTLAVLIVTPSIIFAQGTVLFKNSSTGLVQRWTSSSDPTLDPVPVGGGYVQLLAARLSNPLLHPLGVYEGSSGFAPEYSSLAGFLAANPGWDIPAAGGLGTLPLAPAPISAAPGRFNGGTATIYNNIFDGADADYVVIGWTGPYATYDAAYAADVANPYSSFLGMSAIATTRTGKTQINPGTPFSLGPTFQGMTLALAVIPEPTTVLLTGVAAVLLLLLRQRG